MKNRLDVHLSEWSGCNWSCLEIWEWLSGFFNLQFLVVHAVDVYGYMLALVIFLQI